MTNNSKSHGYSHFSSFDFDAEKNYRFDCFYFNGVKPCQSYKTCHSCADYRPVQKRILYIHTGAMGDIVRQLSLLRMILQKNEESLVTVVTSKLGAPLFKEVLRLYQPRLRIKLIESTSPFYFQQTAYDLLYNLDRDEWSSALASAVTSKEKFGFKLNENGTIGIFNQQAELIYKIGLNDQFKFRENKLHADQLMAESLALVKHGHDFQEDYFFPCTDEVKQKIIDWKRKLNTGTINNLEHLVMGINLGVGKTVPNKRFSAEIFLKLVLGISELKLKGVMNVKKILLLGGAEDKELGDYLQDHFHQHQLAIQSPTHQIEIHQYLTSDVWEGIALIGALDLLVTGDTLALHLAQSLKVPCLAWFGPTHAQEIRLVPTTLVVQWQAACSPCWKVSCTEKEPCYDSKKTLQEVLQALVHLKKNFIK